MKNVGYYNGKIGLIEEMTIPMSDRACYFGDGIYDAACGKNGRIFMLDEHVDRFFNNAGLLSIKLDYTKEDLKRLLLDLVKKVDSDEVFVYWQASRGAAPRNHVFPNVKPTLYITVIPYVVDGFGKKIKLITYEDKRFLHCNIKTINLLPSVLAAEKAQEAGCGEAVFHRGDIVTECAHSNISIIKDGIFKTHPTDCYILPGIARSHLIQICKRKCIPVLEEAFTIKEMMEADEIIVSSSTKFCMAATEIDGVAVCGKAPELLREIQEQVKADFDAYVSGN